MDDNKKCKAIGYACKKLKTPQFGEVKCLELNTIAEYPVGSECYVKCRKGYKLNADALRICTGKGEWSGNDAECIRKYQ